MTSINNNTQNLDLYEKVNFLFKNYLGFPNTDKTKPFFQEVGVKANNYLYGSELFLDDIPISPNFNKENTALSLKIDTNRYINGTSKIETDTTNIIRKFTKIKLQKIPGTNRGYYCLDTDGNNILADAIQFNKVTDSNGNRPYLYELFDNNLDQLFPSAETGNWIFDVKNGVVNFPDETTKVSDSKLPYLTFYKYIGRKGVKSLKVTDIQGFNDSNDNINLLISDLSSNIYTRSFIDASFNYLKTYTDNVASGLDIKESVKLATDSSLNTIYDNGTNGVGATLISVVNEVLTIDDISNNKINDRILVKDQINKIENGIYIIKELGSTTSKYKLQRAVPDDEGRELTGGSFVFVEEGFRNANNGFVFTNNGTPNIGVDNIDVSQFSGAGQLTMGRGLKKNGNTILIEDEIYNRFTSIDSSLNKINISFKNDIDTLTTSLDVSLNNLESRIDASLNDVYTKNYFDISYNNLETRIDASLNNLESRIDASLNDVYTKDYIDISYNNLETRIDASLNDLESRIDASLNDVYTKDYIDISYNNLETRIDASLNDVYTKKFIDSKIDDLLNVNNLTIKQYSDISNNRTTHNKINTIHFDYDTGFNITDISSGEVKISLGSHWKEIKINDASGLIPVGEETLNLKTGNGISIIADSSSNPQSLLFSVDQSFTDISGVPDLSNNKGKFLVVNNKENGINFVSAVAGNQIEIVEELPSSDLFLNKLVIRSKDNTIHRYDISSNMWISVGGAPEEIPQVYSQVSNFDVITLNTGNVPKIINYYDNVTPVTKWNKIVETKYNYTSMTKQIVISYNAFASFNSSYIDSNVNGFGGRSGIMEWVICLDDDIINNSRSYVTIDLIEKYINLKAVINFTEDSSEVDLNKNLVINGEKLIKIYARSIYNNNDNFIKLHQTQNGTPRSDNIEIISLSESEDINNKNITDFKTDILNVNEQKILFSEKNNLVDISDNWTCVNFIENYLPPAKTKNVILKYSPFITFKNETPMGVRGENAVIEWVFKIGDIILPYSRQLIHLDLIEKFFNIETIITLDEVQNLDKNIISEWDKPQTIKLFARSLMNRTSFVRLHKSQIVSELKRPQIEIISVNKKRSLIDLNSKNIIDFKSKMLDVQQETIKYSNKNLINDINDNWTSINFISDYLPPSNTENVILKYTPFITFSNDTILGLRGKNAVIEWIFKIGDTFLPNSRQFIHLDLIEKYFTIETNIKINGKQNLEINSLGVWNRVKSIKIFARSIFNDKNNVRLHYSQVTSKLKRPQIELFSIVNNNSISDNDNIYQEIYTVTDDRYIHNEENIVDGISIIQKLTPKYYIKTNESYNENHNFKINNLGEPVDSSNNKLDINYTFEAGLIAQDIFKISELKHTVEGYENTYDGSLTLPEDKPLGVNYNSILTYTIQALKEVIIKNKQLEDKINDLESKINN